jgi:hypothetical protein
LVNDVSGLAVEFHQLVKERQEHTCISWQLSALVDIHNLLVVVGYVPDVPLKALGVELSEHSNQPHH